MRRLIVLAALTLATGPLSACGGPDPDARAPPRAPDVAANFNQPLDARGADPAWGLKIRGLQFTLDRPNQPDVVAIAPGATLTAHTASWIAAMPDGQAMKVSLYAGECLDRATDAVYPFSAEVVLPGAPSLNGCAGMPARPAAGPAAAKR